jgi:hypothetical protein
MEHMKLSLKAIEFGFRDLTLLAHFRVNGGRIMKFLFLKKEWNYFLIEKLSALQ